ncbi:MAG: hypothetical protein GXP37_12565, partial [Chloroflexi bacterium]|nr:hypothetical protein [Chloroflexota bacterium]
MMRQLMSRGLIILALVLLGSGREALAVGTGAPPGGGDVPLQLVGQWGGSTLAVAIRGPYVVAGIGQRLAVFDITDPDAMQMLGQTDLLPGVVVDIVLQGDYAYVANRSGGLQVIDISQAQQPRAVGAFRMPGDVVRVALAGPYATILNAQLGLRVLDISDPIHPQRVGAYSDLSQPGQLKIAGDWLYVSTRDTIAVFDRSQPAGLHLLARIPTSFLFINDFEIVGDTLYVVGIDDWAESYLAIYDISDWHHVRRLSIQTIPGAYGVTIQQSLAYITAGWGGLSVWDISDVSHPVEISNYREDQTGYYRLQIADSYLVVSQADNGIEWFDLAPNGLPTLLGQYRTLGVVRAIDSYDQYLYAYLGWHRVAIINVAEPNHPLVAGIYENEHWSSGTFIIQDALAYVST